MRQRGGALQVGDCGVVADLRRNLGEVAGVKINATVNLGIGYDAGGKRGGRRRLEFRARLTAAKKRAARAKILRNTVKGKVHKLFVSGTRPVLLGRLARPTEAF